MARKVHFPEHLFRHRVTSSGERLREGSTAPMNDQPKREAPEISPAAPKLEPQRETPEIPDQEAPEKTTPVQGEQ
jgi:hypothetical protein